MQNILDFSVWSLLKINIIWDKMNVVLAEGNIMGNTDATARVCKPLADRSEMFRARLTHKTNNAKH